jgi:hypothetical protein
MTAKPADTAAASVVALPNAWDDAEEWEPTAENSSARVVPTGHEEPHALDQP